MRLSLHEVLAIVGRLDDAPGFDTPRERFRRFLLEHLTSVTVARGLLEQAQASLSEQYQRALQDTVLATGRVLGFETTFGTYERHGSAARTCGIWLSRRRLAVSVQVWADQASVDPAAVGRALEASVSGIEGVAGSRLCVVTAACASRSRLEEAVALRHQPTRIVSLRALLDLAALVERGTLAHDDLLGLCRPSAALDSTVSMLTRLAQSGQGAAPTAARPVRPVAFWVYVDREDRVHVLAETGSADGELELPTGDTSAAAPGDEVAVLAPSRGIVATGRVGRVEARADEAGVDRGVVCVEQVVATEPARAVETEARLNLELQAAVSQDPLVRVTRDEFAALTRPPVSVPATADPPHA